MLVVSPSRSPPPLPSRNSLSDSRASWKTCDSREHNDLICRQLRACTFSSLFFPPEPVKPSEQSFDGQHRSRQKLKRCRVRRQAPSRRAAEQSSRPAPPRRTARPRTALGRWALAAGRPRPAWRLPPARRRGRQARVTRLRRAPVHPPAASGSPLAGRRGSACRRPAAPCACAPRAPRRPPCPRPAGRRASAPPAAAPPLGRRRRTAAAAAARRTAAAAVNPSDAPREP